MNVNQFDWVDFYREFADILLSYKTKRDVLVQKIRDIYVDIEINLPTLEKDNNIIDIDPFTAFGLFNKSSMKEDNRIKIIAAIADSFGVKSSVPTSFDSIPVLPNLNATFYYLDPRGKNDIDDLWSLFESALKYAKNPLPENRQKLSKYFDLVINKKNNGNSKVTMGLYWIAPDSFLNLDGRNTWYIYNSGKIPDSVVETLPEIESKAPGNKISAEQYFDIMEKMHTYLESSDSKLKDFKELSFEAWLYSEEVNQKKKAQRDDKGSALADEDVDTVHYWIYSPGRKACKWEEYYKAGVMGIGLGSIGDLSQYDTKNAMKEVMREKIDPSRSFINDSQAAWQFANEMKPGDIVFVKKGFYQLIGRGIVTSDYYYDDSKDDDYPNFREVDWTDYGEWEHPGQAVPKALTDITPYTDYVAKLNAIFVEDDEDGAVDVLEPHYPSYDSKKFLEEVYMDKGSYEILVDLVRTKKNVILQGAPGVGKTYVAKRLAYSMMGLKIRNGL